MSHPRAVFPASMADEYRTKSISQIASEYHASNHTIRRWLAERVALRRQGIRIKRGIP